MTTLQADTQKAPAPGIYPDVPFEDYLRWPHISQSTLKEGRASMAHLKAAIDGERHKVATDDMILGSALHTAFLEPELAAAHIARWDGGARRGKAWEEFKAEHAGKSILTLDAHARLVGMVRKLRKHPVVREWAAKMEATEVAAVGEIEGTMMKGRCDALTADPLVDLKKVRSTDPLAINRTILAFGYHIQAYLYRRLFNRDRFMLICIEAEPPFDAVAYEMSPAYLRQGEREAVALLQRMQFCQRFGAWPGRSDEVVLMEPPEWLIGEDDDCGISIGGDSAFEE